MTEEEKEAQYIKAYNNGYMLEKHEPELLGKILKSVKKDNPYFEALQEGQRQQQREQYIQNREKEQADRERNRGRGMHH
ncbi:MAG TPA: hypothetical protein VHA52_10465 [Candidatus Babeliaceae bacterium]|nr:hypothetical protein [Candidatus Babeliaceae bacterium]